MTTLLAPILCRHRAELTGTNLSPCGPIDEHRCRHPRHQLATDPTCVVCQDWQALEEPPLVATRPKDPSQPRGVIVDRFDKDAGFADAFLGCSAFLLLGGPSLRSLPLHELGRRGCLTIALNNAPGALPPGTRPQLWLHGDPAGKFHNAIWRDPGIVKFSPVTRWKTRARDKYGICVKEPDGTFLCTDDCPADMPATFGYQRNHEFCPERWLTEPSINNGNDKKHADNNGWPHEINTMFAAVRLCYYLGVRTLYLLGCDFSMNAAQPYAVEQGKEQGGVNAVNEGFEKMSRMWAALKPYFDKAGFQVFNCNPQSGLWVFPFTTFEAAVNDATHDFPAILDSAGWYR